MKKIEQRMIKAIKNNEYFKVSNTQVLRLTNSKCVYLYNNLICEITDESIKVFHCGYTTSTTKSRLNAILESYSLPSLPLPKVYQKDFQWYIGEEQFNAPKEFMYANQ